MGGNRPATIRVKWVQPAVVGKTTAPVADLGILERVCIGITGVRHLPAMAARGRPYIGCRRPGRANMGRLPAAPIYTTRVQLAALG